MDLLVVGDGDTRDEAAHFRRDDGDIAAYVCVVGAFDEATDGPPVVAEHCG